MRFGSVCSGIEAASAAWHPLGWQAAWFSEIEPFPCAVLAHHYPGVPNLGDMTALPARIRAGEVEAPDLLCGGTPCQAFSVAGLRRSLDDARGNLSLTFCEIADAIDAARSVRRQPPALIFWENVPGVLSTSDNAFGCFLAGLAGDDEPAQAPGGKWKVSGVVVGPERLAVWRVLDAQFFGVAQRRRRVFVLGVSLRHPRAWAIAESLLPLQQGVQRNPPSRREARQGAARGAAAGAGVGQPYAVANCLTQRMHKGINTTLDEGQTPVLAHALRGEGFDTSEDGTGRGTPLVPVTFRADAMREGSAKTPSRDAEGRVRLRDPGMGMYEDIAPTLDCGAAHGVAHAFDARQSDVVQYGDKTGPLDTDGHTIGVAIAFSAKDHGADAGEVAPTLRAMGHGASHANGGGQVAVMQPVAFHENQRGEVTTKDTAGSLKVGGGKPGQGYPAVMQPVAFDTTQITSAANYSNPKPGDPCHPLAAGAHAPAVAIDTYNQTEQDTAHTIRSTAGMEGVPATYTAMQVRRLTPRECERLQGFPDDYTAIPWRGKPADQCPDGPRYKALGNSWAVPVVRWIGSRIDACLKETTT